MKLTKRAKNTILTIIVCVLLSGIGSEISYPGGEKLTPEAVVARHLQSIGNRDLLAKTQSRVFIGPTKVRFHQGSLGELGGQGQFASDGRKLGMLFRYNGQDYRGEHFAFDGKDVSVGRFLPGKISILAEFVNRFNDLMKQGLLGGALSVAWPLRNLEAIRQQLKYHEAKLGGRPVPALEYRAKGNLRDFKIMLFFEPATFHHIRTEYRLHINAAITGAFAIGIDKPDTYYVLSEEFADFREVDGMTLPHQYSIGYSSEGQAQTFLATWIIEAERWQHNGKIDPLMFTAGDVGSY